MGRLFLVELEREDPNTRLVVCRQCQTHLAFLHDFKLLGTDAGQGHEQRPVGLMFSKAVNIQVDSPDHHRVSSGKTLADIYCVKCGDRLGVKIVKDERPEQPDNLVESEEGWYHMLLDKIQQCNGEEYWELEVY